MSTASALFVVGNSRSGTTLMARIMGRHPDVLMFRELHFFEELWSPAAAADGFSVAQAEALAATLLSIQREGYMARRDPAAWAAEARELCAGAGAALQTPGEVFKAFISYETRRAGVTLGCEQTPRNVFYLEQVFALFPDALVIEMVRDPRDVMLSKKRKWKRSYLGDSKRPWRAGLLSWANYHPLLTARLWVAAVRAGGRCADNPRVLRVRYEDLLADGPGVVAQICAAAGLSFEPTMLEVRQVGSSSAADSEATGLSQEAAGRWQRGGLDSTEIAVCERAAGAPMQALGYAESGAQANPLRLALYYLLLPVKLGAALLLNFNRLRSLGEAVRRRLN